MTFFLVEKVRKKPMKNAVIIEHNELVVERFRDDIRQLIVFYGIISANWFIHILKPDYFLITITP